MKKITCIAAVLALAACNDAPSEAPVAEETMAAEPTEAASMAVDGNPSAGKYKVTGADGATWDYEVLEDGTYTVTGSDGTTVTGTWTEATPGAWCETPEGGEEACYTETMNEDGTWTATSNTDPENVATVERVES
ncbi:hypothetical protein [Croceicoccus sediminis]|uniref:hypothetical protein n=1 Tax=Croceicoccus sediminis TaxID=2571150 RepID=UPI0011824D7D|nr:hypothetical protein [Croceicoccus sediminis]